MCFLKFWSIFVIFLIFSPLSLLAVLLVILCLFIIYNIVCLWFSLHLLLFLHLFVTELRLIAVLLCTLTGVLHLFVFRLHLFLLFSSLFGVVFISQFLLYLFTASLCYGFLTACALDVAG